MLDRAYMQDSVEERFKEQKAAAEEAVEPEVDEQGKPLNKKQRLQAKRAAEKERARQRQAAQGLMAPSVSSLPPPASFPSPRPSFSRQSWCVQGNSLSNTTTQGLLCTQVCCCVSAAKGLMLHADTFGSM